MKVDLLAAPFPTMTVGWLSMPNIRTVIANVGSGAFVRALTPDPIERSQIMDHTDDGPVCPILVRKPMSWGMFNPVGPWKNIGSISFPDRGVKRVLVAT